MKQELDELLCKKYPHMMVNRDKSMMETCMCWGFDCGDGWFPILDQLMGNIQHHIDWNNKNFEGYNIDAIINNKMVSWISKTGLELGACVIVKAKIKDHTKHWKHQNDVTRLNYVKAAQ